MSNPYEQEMDALIHNGFIFNKATGEFVGINRKYIKSQILELINRGRLEERSYALKELNELAILRDEHGTFVYGLNNTIARAKDRINALKSKGEKQ